MTKRYSIGLDFGTLSARAIIANVANGETLPYESVFNYPHAVMQELNGTLLPKNYALQHPSDYIKALEFLLCDVINKNHIEKDSIIGIGIDFTDCTVLPVTKDMTPLCMLDEYKNEPHAYAKLWKHHAKEEYTDIVSAAAHSYHDDILSVTGGKMTSEFLIPKLYEIFREAPQIYNDTYKFISAGDFIASLLIGKKLIHSKAYSAKQHYNGNKYPTREFFSSIDEGFADVYEKKTVLSLSSVEKSAGYLCEEWAIKTGLSSSVAISAPILDAHSAIAASGIEEGRATLVLGTSAVFETLTKGKKSVDGALATSFESIAEGFTTIEASIAAMGDLFDWYIKNNLPASYESKARELKLNAHQYLRSLAEKQEIGAHGLIALDWWNGSRAIVLDNNLSGMILGLRLSTKPEDIYRALIESAIFAIRQIFDSFISAGIKIDRLSATGGIALKDPFLMQICASVLNIPIDCLASKQATALGSAIYGAVAGGAYESVTDASRAMRSKTSITYYPIKNDHIAYEKIYKEYLRLYKYFSNENHVMEVLRNNK